jgi:siderophore synthetase component
MKQLATDVRLSERQDKLGWERTIAQSSDAVLSDLVNALLAEELLLGENESSESCIASVSRLPLALRDVWLSQPDDLRSNKSEAERLRELVLWKRGIGAGDVLISVEKAYHQPYRMKGAVMALVIERQEGLYTLERLDLETFLGWFESCLPETIGYKISCVRFFEQLRVSVKHKALSLQAAEERNGNAPDFPSSLLKWESWAAIRDRPFHPAAKAKIGWADEEYRQYGAEHGRTFLLEWIAVRKNVLRCGSGSSGQDIAAELLSPKDRSRVGAAFDKLGLSEEEYVALPVHPWQMANKLPLELEEELRTGTCVLLHVLAGEYAATSSVRSLVSATGDCHVKLPLGVIALGAIRSLPALYMANGERGQRLLEQLREADETLARQLYVCDESAWWAFMPKAEDWFDDRPRHLSCQLRRYHAQWQQNERTQLIPLSAFSVRLSGSKGHLFDSWLEAREMPFKADAVLELFAELAGALLKPCLRMLRYGVMPEVHGQNVLLILNQAIPSGIVLRDHDTVRLYLPWLESNGFSDPGYIVREGRANSLYNETPEQLLYYLQTLGIQVNLYAIAESLSRRYGIGEALFWKSLKDGLQGAIDDAGWQGEDRMMIEEALFRKAKWPWKQIVTPLLLQEGKPVGSMPAGSGLAPNPFVVLDAGGQME